MSSILHAYILIAAKQLTLLIPEQNMLKSDCPNGGTSGYAVAFGIIGVLQLAVLLWLLPMREKPG